ncbi:GntR family transcriptional regulator [Shimia biformata]|uniref:GntR family transcriptional regulator n=1 Tax=Shimia biformata TaxID=1294299 RepID=UPI001950790B|nr:GntR family transcriptional regulator [Shimia biformata]
MQTANVGQDSNNTAPAPAHQQVYHQLRESILFGDFTPGQPVTIQGLVTELGAGMTPVREAIRRLTAEGALEFQGNRRVTVPELNAGNVDELIIAREALEPALAQRAAERATAEQIAALEATDLQLDRAIEHGDIPAYLRLNYEFHAQLYAIAAAPILTQIADGLWLRFGPSLRVVCGRMGTQNLPDRHKETIDAMRLGDVEKAREAIREDVIQGMVQIREALYPATA